MGKLPAYMVMHDNLKNDIKNGKYLVGELLLQKPSWKRFLMSAVLQYDGQWRYLDKKVSLK
jgi:hypothetical protein